MPKFNDLTGNRFERLIVLKQVENKNGRTCWLCKCDCGNYKEIIGIRMTTGKNKSCGCMEEENRRKKKHGLSEHRIYKIHKGMIDRCYNFENKKFKDYGGRGISVCKEWLDEEVGLYNFFKWSNENDYKDELSIDRIDTNGNYEPSNCRWSNNIEQNNNRRNNVLITINGESKTVPQWGREYGISPSTIRSRIRKGWKNEDLIKPSRSRRKS